MQAGKVKLDQGLTIDEEQRISRHEEVKGKVRGEVHEEIRQEIEQLRAAGDEKAGSVARELKEKAFTELKRTEAELERGKGAARLAQIVDYVFYVIYGLIGLEVLLALIGARERSGFKRFLDTIAAPVLAPFKGLMPDPSLGPFRLMLSYLIAAFVYFMLQRAIRGLLRLMVHRQTQV